MTDTGFISYNNDKDDLLAREIIRENTGGKDPAVALADDFLEEIDLRLEQVKVFYPIVELLKRRKPEDGLSALVPELCFLTLSYLIYEGKLKYRGITFRDLEAFLSKAVKEILPDGRGRDSDNTNGAGNISEDVNRNVDRGANVNFNEDITGNVQSDIEQEKIRGLTSEILDALQNGGRNFVFNTYSFKIGGFREKYVKFLEIKQSEDGTLQYYVTEQGVDFFLKTKEFPDETKITINLLLFQKQMEKGAFGFAYETVKRLNMEVQKKKDRKYTLLEALMYGRLDLGEAYNSYHKSIVMQFREESELFNAATKAVNSAFNEYMEIMNKGSLTLQEERAFTLIKIIEREIGKAQTLHTQLLKEAASFTREYDNALGVRRKAIFTERFNFQGEFEKIISRKERPETLKYLFEPLLSPRIPKAFNPLKIFEPQRISKDRDEGGEDGGDAEKTDRITYDQKVRRRVRENFVFYAAYLLEALRKHAGQISLKDFCAGLKADYSEDVLYNGDFIGFIIEMNREKKPGETTKTIDFSDGRLQADEELKSMEEVFLKALFMTRENSARQEGTINRVTVKSFPEEEAELLPGLKITNMLFTGERKL